MTNIFILKLIEIGGYGIDLLMYFKHIYSKIDLKTVKLLFLQNNF